MYDEQLHNLYSSDDQMKEDEKGKTCSMYGKEEKCIQGFTAKT
jgi:hypothetical protein